MTSQPQYDDALAVGDQTEDLAEVETLSKVVAPLRPLGVTGLNRSVGYVNEEFLPALRGPKASQIYREMLSNSPLIGASVTTIEMLLKNVSWEVEAPNDTESAKKAEEIVRESMDEMDTSWRDFIAEALSFIWYGWAFFETTYVKRGKYIGWADMSIRGQESLIRWVFDDYGRSVGMVQSAPPRYTFTTIPTSRGVHIRNRGRKRNPEGISALRNAYEAWYYSKRMMQVEAIGIERDLAGLPIMWLPADILRDSDKNPAKKAQLEQFTKLVRSVRRDANEGLMLPLEYDTETKQKRYEFQLLTSGGRPAVRHRQDHPALRAADAAGDDDRLHHARGQQPQRVLRDAPGQDRDAARSPQWACESDRRGPEPSGDPPADGAELHPEARTGPRSCPSDVDAPDLGQLAQFMSAMAAMGMQFFPDADMESFVRKSARMPDMTDEERTVRTQEKKKADITRFLGVQQSLLEAKAAIRDRSAHGGHLHGDLVGSGARGSR